MSKWQLMAEQARQKREGALDMVSPSQPGKDVKWRSLSTPTRNLRDNQEAKNRSQSTAPITLGMYENGIILSAVSRLKSILNMDDVPHTQGDLDAVMTSLA